jgi:hypothetical protein
VSAQNALKSAADFERFAALLGRGLTEFCEKLHAHELSVTSFSEVNSCSRVRQTQASFFAKTSS